VQVREIQEGNRNLVPETADTWTAGMVVQPSFLPRFSFSIDYFNIQVDNVIGSLGAPVLVAGCDAGIALYCESVRYNPNGTVAFVIAQQLNLNQLRTSGLDFEAAYTFAAFGGDFSVRGLATFTDELTTVQPAGPVNRVGRLSAHQRILGVPEWRGNVDLTYRRDSWSMNLQARYIGAGYFNPDLVEGAGYANTVNDNSVPAFVYFNFGAQYGFDVMGRSLELFGLVNNLLDTDPPWLPSGAAGGTNETSSNAGQGYDLIGRSYKVGLRFRF
jgi:outer membrane receptor protein involved in Fe transport